MTHKSPLTALLIASLAWTLAAAPATADRVLTLKSHTDAMSMMGQEVPAKTETHTYWFSDRALRYDAGDFSYVADFDGKKMVWINHPDKSYSTMDMPIDFKKIVPPEMAPMMEQMMGVMSSTAKVVDTGRSASYGGFDCSVYKVDISMAMMSSSMEVCVSKALPVDYSRYRELVESQANMFPNSKWMSELAKIDGFPVRNDTTTTMMGKSFKSWQEIVSSEDRPAPAGTYAPPAGYQEKKFDPMSAAAGTRKRGR